MPGKNFGSEYLERESHCIEWDGEEIWGSYLLEGEFTAIRVTFDTPARLFEQYLCFNFYDVEFEIEGEISKKFKIRRSNVDRFQLNSAKGAASRIRVWNGWNDSHHGDSEWNGWQGMKLVENSDSKAVFTCSDGLAGGPNFGSLAFTMEWE